MFRDQLRSPQPQEVNHLKSIQTQKKSTEFSNNPYGNRVLNFAARVRPTQVELTVFHKGTAPKNSLLSVAEAALGHQKPL